MSPEPRVYTREQAEQAVRRAREDLELARRDIGYGLVERLLDEADTAYRDDPTRRGEVAGHVSTLLLPVVTGKRLFAAALLQVFREEAAK